MGNKGKLIPIDKQFRETLKRLGFSSLDEMPEFSEAELDEFFKAPFIREFVPDLQRALANNDEVEMARIWHEIKRKNHEVLKEQEKKLKELAIGIQNRKGGFTCLDCITSAAWGYIDEDVAVTLWDLKDGALFQCDNCKKKIDLKGKFQITVIRKKVV